MREIKFRYRVEIPAGFEKSSPEKHVKIEYYTLEEIEKGKTLLNHVMLKTLSRDRYTGLKDKNGVEIYEGDIVNRIGGEVSVIVFHDAGFKYRHHTENLYGTLVATDTLTEVIGNIMENPELLKENSND